MFQFSPKLYFEAIYDTAIDHKYISPLDYGKKSFSIGDFQFQTQRYDFHQSCPLLSVMQPWVEALWRERNEVACCVLASVQESRVEMMAVMSGLVGGSLWNKNTGKKLLKDLLRVISAFTGCSRPSDSQKWEQSFPQGIFGNIQRHISKG